MAFSTMIRQWRLAFGAEFPFYYVQIAPFNDPHNAAYLREARFETLSLLKTGMVVTMDIGNLSDIHPKNKQAVGRRLAIFALANNYGKKVIVSGPLYKDATFHEGSAEVEFDRVGGGLGTRDGGPSSHFELAGSDKAFYPAAARIIGNRVLVSSDKVKKPKAVRKGFTRDAMPNVMNKAGLPARPFRTDRW